jgi:hypothetical protein
MFAMTGSVMRAAIWPRQVSTARSTAPRSFHGTTIVSSSARRLRPELSGILIGS